MLGIDGAKQEAWRRSETRESATERRLRVLAENVQKATLSVADDAGFDVSDLEAQIGRPLTSEAVQAKLKKCNPNLHFERSQMFPSLTGIYLRQGAETKHVCGMESGIMPEFSVLHKKTIKVPNKELFGKKRATRDVGWTEIETFESETRGWRTVLVRLLHAGLIKRIDVETHFGWTPSRESEKWAEQTR